MAYLLPIPDLVLTKTLSVSTNIGNLLDEFLQRADLKHPYMGLIVDLPGYANLADSRGNRWNISRLIVAIIKEDLNDRSLTFTELKCKDSYERKQFEQYLQSELKSVALNACVNQTVFIEFDRNYELKGIPAQMRAHSKYGDTTSYAIVGVIATLLYPPSLMRTDPVEVAYAEENAKRSDVLCFERLSDDCDERLTKRLLDWLMTDEHEYDLRAIQRQREVWHEYLRGQEIVYAALKRYEDL